MVWIKSYNRDGDGVMMLYLWVRVMREESTQGSPEYWSREAHHDCHEVDVARVHGEELEYVEEVGHWGHHQRGLHPKLGHQGRGWEAGEGETEIENSTPRNIETLTTAGYLSLLQPTLWTHPASLQQRNKSAPGVLTGNVKNMTILYKGALIPDFGSRYCSLPSVDRSSVR